MCWKATLISLLLLDGSIWLLLLSWDGAGISTGTWLPPTAGGWHETSRPSEEQEQGESKSREHARARWLSGALWREHSGVFLPCPLATRMCASAGMGVIVTTVKKHSSIRGPWLHLPLYIVAMIRFGLDGAAGRREGNRNIWKMWFL